MKVLTKDFQRLKGENEFEFPIGITVIQGRSGSGKSTVFYAVEDCLSNPSGVADVINWDAKSAEVVVENDGGYVKWIKTPSSCEYVDKNGKPYVKASKLDSRNIDNLGFYFDKKDNIVNIHNEWSKLFPFDASDTEMFKLFEDIFNISSSFQIIESIKKDEQECKSKINDLNSKINDLTIHNNRIEDILNEVDSDVDKYMALVSDSKNKFDELNNALTVYSNNKEYATLYIPSDFDTNSLNQLYNEYQNILADCQQYAKNLTAANITIPEMQTFDLKDNPYKNDYDTYLYWLQQIENIDADITKLDKEKELLEEKLGDIKVCPTCGRPL